MDKEHIANLHNVKQLEQNGMTDTERILFIEQLMEEDDVMEMLASLDIVPMPAYLEEEILQAVIQEESVESQISAVEVEKELQKECLKIPKWLQLFSYSLKIASAAACAIVVLFRIPEVDAMADLEQRSEAWAQETIVREEAAEKRRQEILEEQEKRRQAGDAKGNYIVDALQYISEKIFMEE